MKISVWKIEQKLGEVEASANDGLEIVGDDDFRALIEDLRDADYPSNREFVADLPKRLQGFIWAQEEG